jgi:hypothetical protein
MQPPVPEPAAFRLLDAAKILATLSRLRDRILERFPDSGLGRLAGELVTLGGETVRQVEYLRRPHWPIRLSAAALIALMVTVLAATVASVRLAAGIEGLDELVQAADAVISLMVFLGAAIFFLVTLESRLKRRRALGTLHQLRSLAHVVDMHQLTKDPERLTQSMPDTPSSPARSLSPVELGRYLDYCSELLSVISKLAALHVQHFNDPVTLAAVNDVESLTTGLSNKIWQKITLLGETSKDLELGTQ